MMTDIRRLLFTFLFYVASSSATLTVQRSASDTLVAATINTTETAFAQQYTVRAGYFTTNRPLVVSFDIDETSTNLGQRIKIRLGGIGGAVLYDSTNLGTTAVTSRTQKWMCELTGTAAAGASVGVEINCGGDPSSSTFPMQVANTIAQPVNVATNADQALVITMTYAGNTAGNSVTLRTLYVWDF